MPQRSGAKIQGNTAPPCRFRFFRALLLKINDAWRTVLRRGKKLVSRAYIATGNDETEFGEAMVPRERPFRSSYCKRQSDATPTISTRKERCPQTPTRGKTASLVQSETSHRQ